jgi:tripartite-type tricarboxylate transporter receptor subunit TctC
MRLIQTLAAVFLAALASGTLAQDFPAKPVRFISSFPPGGGVDLMARLVAQAMSPKLGQPVVVENRAGAAGVVGSAAVANADPDGYTVLVTGDVPITSAHLLSKVPYDPQKAFLPLVKGVEVPTTVLVLNDAPFKTMKDLIDHARANPGKVSWGTPGNGTSMHVEVEMLKEKFGVDIVHVPYKGAAPIMADVMGRTITVGAPGLPPTIGNIKSGKLRLLALWGPSRAAAFPEVPTVREALGDPSLIGYPTWYGFLLPAGAPKEVAAKLESAIIDALKDPAVARKLSDAGATVVAQPSAAFAEANRKQTEAFAAIFKKLNLKPD